MAVPYVLQLKNGVNAINFNNTFEDKPSNLTYLPGVTLQQMPVPVLAPLNVNKKDITNIQLQSNGEPQSPINYVYQVVYPNQVGPHKQVVPEPIKRGRNKKKKIEKPQEVKKEPVQILKPAPRTRSGRVVKFPKHIEKDFKKLETNDTKKSTDNDEVETSDFTTFVEKPISKPQVLPQLKFHQRRRKIAAQYRCPKCLKAYLGKTKMIQHIKKYPHHGPLPQKENNFELWNYLVDITQRCSPAQRGIKFCEELTNLLHNMLLLTSALFKEVEHNKNFVEVDKVLGNAIGLPSGCYTFNDNELCKDVSVMKLITTTDVFKPVDSTDVPNEKQRIPTVNSELKHQTIYFNNHVEPQIATDLEGTPDDYGKKDEAPQIDSELLSDNSLLHLSNIRNELMLSSVDPGGTLLDNSTSSDEVMNVDQFVNERFKKITEPDLELGTSSLNLELPSLDLFQFHTT